MKYSLVGVDGNAFSIMGAESSDYHNLLTVSADKIHQLNKSLEDN